MSGEAAASRSPASAAPAADAPLWALAPDAAAIARACAAGLARARAAIGRVRAAAAPRTVANALVPYDEALLELDAVGSQASLLENVHPDAAVRAAAESATRDTAALGTELSLDRGVYDALRAIDLADADPATRHYVDRTLREFRLSGVDRDDEARRRIQALNDEIVAIGQEFSRNIRSDVRRVSAPAAALEGLPEDFIARHPPGPDGQVTITTEAPDANPVFLYAHSEALRKSLLLAYHNRAHPRNVAVLDQLIARRHALARELGFRSWADCTLANKMAENADRVADFIDRIVATSGARAARDTEQLLARKRAADPAATTIAAWESAYLSEQVRKAEYAFDAQSVRPYFPFAAVKQGVLDLAARLFDVTFRRAERPVWHPSVECWEMFDGGALAGRFYLDMHPRPDKYSHAAQFDIRTGVAGGQIPEAVLVCNFPGGTAGDPGLMEHGDVRTLFHEFGHLFHNLFAGRQRWLGIGGIRNELDFVEVPSQLFEEWTWDPAVLATFARHVDTGEVLPADTVRQMKRASDFGKGLAVRRQMVFAGTSLALFDRDPTALDTDAVVREFTTRYQPFPFVEGTHMQCSFGHLEGYSAGYYAYMWSLVIAKDVLSGFDAGHMLDPAPARRYRRLVLEPGASKPANEIVEGFLGRPFGFAAYEAWLNEG